MDPSPPLAKTRVITSKRFPTDRAANIRPTLEPGFYRLGSSVIYVAASGQVYRLRSPRHRVLLVRVDGNEVLTAEAFDPDDSELCVLAEAADSIEAARTSNGFYMHRVTETVYYVSLERVFVFDGPSWREAVELPPNVDAFNHSDLTLWTAARTIDRFTGKIQSE